MTAISPSSLSSKGQPAAEEAPGHRVLSLQEIQALATRILVRHGLTEPHADALADVITAAERDECASHGTYRLAGLVRTIAAGKVNVAAKPKIQSDQSAIVRVDADMGFSSLAFTMGIDALTERARSHGVAAMAINRCFHFTALWPEVEALAERGLVSLAMTPSHSWVAPNGGRTPLFGTNPLAFGWPRPGHLPYIFDFATSVVARGEIELHRQRNQPIPYGWALDRQGNPTNDPIEAMAGAQMTFGGHKGSALSTMIELLAGPLVGDMTSPQSQAFDDGDGGAPCHGELIIALSPDMFIGTERDRHFKSAERLLEAIPAQGARLPSSRRFAARARTTRDGVRISGTQYDILMQLLAQDAAANLKERP